MKKILLPFLLIVIFVLTAGVSSAQAYSLEGEVKLTKRGLDYFYKIYLDGDRFYAVNKQVPDQQLLILGSDLYMISLNQKMARHIKANVDSTQGIKQFLGQPVPDDFKAYLEKKKAKKTGKESFLNLPCEIYKYKDGEKELTREYTVFYEPVSGFPLKTLVNSEFYGESVYQFETVKFQKPDAKLFQLPKGFKVIEGFEKNSPKGTGDGR